MYSSANTLVFGYSPPVSVGVGSKIGQICGVFSSKDSKNAHFLTFLNSLHSPNNIKNKKQDRGFAQTPSLARPQGQVTNLSYPYGECWVDSRRQVKCTATPPLTPLHLRGGSKTIRSRRSWKPVKACEATACGQPLQVGGDPTLRG